MPRKNKTPQHQYYSHTPDSQSKRRYPNERAAQKAADEAMLLDHSLQLSTYRGLDGGWYLTSRRHTTET